ncbi:FAD-dependent oxidoreductase [Vibrio sinensis]|uniref:FAD-dependent oxidoreductase n=1 Tax=Vibrio sinensis TaxID=2302434 RepID=A0A3A6QF23_9VIBR|nr:FAD-dependent oxidoreductase [Vibrio sinensis]RJX71467.1 FAD-dependent oxidoreductase [Vibrio sinensis]
MSTFEHLLKPGKIGSMTVRNRIVSAPMGTNLAEADGHCSERIQAFYEARAKGGAGLITMGVGSVAYPAGTAEPYQVGLSSDEFLPGLTQLTERVHKHGAKIAIQLQHAGKTAVRDMAEGRELWVPSMPPPAKLGMMAALSKQELASFVRPKGGNVKIRVMEKPDIEQMVFWFADAAERAKKAGFDGVEIHAAHSYIIAGFLSKYYNKRTDEYGGSFENRTRLLREIIAAVRQRVGQDYPVWLRLDACELRTPEGIDLDDCLHVAKLSEKLGIDAVSISAYATTTSGDAFTEAPLVHKPAGFLDWATEVAKQLVIPVIAVGRLEPEIANKAIEKGQCSFVAMGRKLLADPELPNKLIANNPKSIRPCIYCYACVSEIFINKRVKCAVNPAMGHESEYQITLAERQKHVVIVGGGPGGMEAASQIARRGHKVTLIEQDKRLGGTLFFASMVYPENSKLLDHLYQQIDHPMIDVQLNTNATKALLIKLQPDEVVIATGALRGKPDIKGADQKHVWSGDELRKVMTSDSSEVSKEKFNFIQRTMLKSGQLSGVTGSVEATRKLSHLWMPLADNVCIIGGGLVGLELAEFLAQRGRKVTVLEPSEMLGKELSIVRRWRVLHEVEKLGVTMHNSVTIKEITAKQVHYTFDGDENVQTAQAGSVILAVGTETNTSMADDISSIYPVHQVGDCTSLDFIEGALSSAWKIAAKI